jgi:hypothetical protein
MDEQQLQQVEGVLTAMAEQFGALRVDVQVGPGANTCWLEIGYKNMRYDTYLGDTLVEAYEKAVLDLQGESNE